MCWRTDDRYENTREAEALAWLQSLTPMERVLARSRPLVFFLVMAAVAVAVNVAFA